MIGRVCKKQFEVKRFDIMKGVSLERRSPCCFSRAGASTAIPLKIELAEKFPNDIDAYCSGKDFLIKEILEEALRWYEGVK